MTQAYPLQFPIGKPRTKNPQPSRFDTSFACARDGLMGELDRLGVMHPVLSTNVELRLDGLPYARRTEPDDKGVAVYFQLNGQAMCFACDKWDKVGDNIHAIAKTISAIRGISRWGSDDMLKAAFSGFVALPAPSKTRWYELLGIPESSDSDAIKTAFRYKSKTAHPDNGGSEQELSRLIKARDEGLSS